MASACSAEVPEVITIYRTKKFIRRTHFDPHYNSSVITTPPEQSNKRRRRKWKSLKFCHLHILMAKRNPLYYFTPLAFGFLAFHMLPIFRTRNFPGENEPGPGPKDRGK